MGEAGGAGPQFAVQSKLAGVMSRWLGRAMVLFGLVAVVVAGWVFVPTGYYWLFPSEVVPQLAATAGSPMGGDFAVGASLDSRQQLPDQDLSLPVGSWLIIDRIGVWTPLRKTADPDEALAKGVWQVPEYGDPGDRTLPVILAAHRYGFVWWWQKNYWQYHSFYRLPELEPGDWVELIADQRKWVYEVYAGELGEEITDYQADLILYTCQDLTGPRRHFRYARLIDPTINTQQAMVSE